MSDAPQELIQITQAELEAPALIGEPQQVVSISALVEKFHVVLIRIYDFGRVSA
jgi:hypothetical protein